jgi:hypothetical protein
MAVLVALHALVLGLDTGTMAGAALARTVLCTSDGAGSIPATPAEHRDHDCCLTGCAAPTVAALPPAIAIPAPVGTPAPAAIAAVSGGPSRHLTDAAPRGPPRLA